jgi:WD40 repeat protein
LIQEAGYVAVADPVRLLTLLPDIGDDASLRFVDIYNRVADRLIGQSPMDRLPLIHMTAQMEMPELAPRLEPPVVTRWRCRWAHVQPSAPHRIIGRHADCVTSIAVGEIDGRAVVVSSSSDNRVRLWDVRTGYPISSLVARSVTTVALGTIDGRPVVVAGGSGSSVVMFDPIRAELIDSYSVETSELAPHPTQDS